MLRSSSRASRARALVASLALAVPAGTALAAPAGADEPTAAGAPAPAAISLWAPAQVTAPLYGHRAWTDLGLRVVADGAPFELWSQRPSYDDPIRTVWRSGDGDVPLPAGAMKDFSGIRGFVKIDLDPQRPGADTLHLSPKSCFNGWAERVRPDAPARSPYPSGCWYNPYTLGSVQGVQEGWATPILTMRRGFRLEPGHYTVTARVAPAYATLFVLSEEQATRTIDLTVVSQESGAGGTAVPGRADRPADHPADHRPTGPQGRADAGGPVPDLRSLPAWGISMARNGNFLRFSATVWNGGDSPLVVDGFRRDGEDEMDAYQYFFDAAGEQTGYQAVGHLHWDPKPTHQHWHFEDFARYSLLDADLAEVVRSKKEAFCLANTDGVDLTVPDADWQPENTDLSTSCGDSSSLSIREVLAAGWGDSYVQYRAGQSFDLRGLPNGTYYIAVTANPLGNLVEASTDNNVSLREIRISGREGNRTVTVPKVGIIDEGGYGGTG